MKRKIIYLLTGAVVLIGILVVVFYQERKQNRIANLGSDVIYFSEASAPSSDTDGESTATSNPDSNASALPGSTDAASAAPAPSDSKDTASATPAPSASAKPDSSSYQKITSSAKIVNYNDTGVTVIGDTAYELFSYVDSAAEKYAKAVNRLTKAVDKDVSVYDLIAPTSAGITIPDNKIKKVNTSSQKDSLEKIEQKLSGREIFVSLYDKMMQHRTEYIYFRTDHHWTAKGAYYAYQAFCEAKGITPHKLSEYKKKISKGYLGTFYTETNQDKNLKKDNFAYYLPLSSGLSMEYTTSDGTKSTAPVVADASQYGESLKYCAFIAGDNPYSVIKNKKLKDNSSCVVVKESFGNAFVPYLADHYQTIYVIDYRYWEGDLTQFIKKKNIPDVILINNISMTRNSYLIGRLSQIIP